MEAIARLIIRYRKAIIVVFLIAAAASAILQRFVAINYKMVDYLPPDAQSTVAIGVMEQEFDQTIPNARVMVKNVGVTDALQYKQKLLEIDGVSEVLWLDDVVDIKKPLELYDADTVETYYKDGSALFSVTIREGMESAACKAIKNLIGEDNHLSGEAAGVELLQGATKSESMGAMAILIPIVIFILLISSTSWVEPLLFLAAIGVSVVINMGTNLIFGRISFMTNSVSPIMQLAVSLDYAIFLLHSFADHRKTCPDAEEAMRRAIRQSFSAVSASAATTIFGFIALIFMQFRIGADLGLILAKGIILSFLCVIVFLPALTLSVYKLIDRTRHKEWTPSFKNVYRGLSKVAIPVFIAVALIIVPCYLGQRHTSFVYGSKDFNPNSRYSHDTEAIDAAFGQSVVVALLVPRGDIAKEQQLMNDLEQQPHVTGVISYANTVGAEIPQEFLEESITSQFYSAHYARIIVSTDTASEGDIAFNTVERISAAAKSYFGDTIYAAGQSANLYDIRTVVARDNSVINIIAVLSIFGILLLTFRSAMLPLILLLTIETGIWINLAIPYFSGISMNFIGYLVISTVQLGATVDYAILLTDHYLANRKRMGQREAMHASLGETFKSILVSASTLASAGFTLYATSTNPSVSGLGLLLGRGTLLSMVMVVCLLPALLTLFDKAIAKTTYKADFFGHVNKRPREAHDD